MTGIGHRRDDLLGRKEDIYTALRRLEEDRRDGTVDAQVYGVARERYEAEAALVLEQLDSLNATEGPDAPPVTKPASGRHLHIAIPVTLGAVVIALILFLVTSLNGRGNGQSITGEQPPVAATPAPAVPVALAKAQSAVQRHPHSVTLLIALGNAYLNAGNPTAADRAYWKAMHLAPGQPEAATLHALVLASSKEDTAALSVLATVERTNPRYARAWLLDGLVASRRRPGYPRAIAAWKRFLALGDTSPVAAQVRASLARLEKAEGSKR